MRSTTAINSFRNSLEAALHRIGINFFYHINLQSYSDARQPFGSFQKELYEEYIAEGYHLHDFALQHVMSGGDAIFRSAISQYLSLSPLLNESFMFHHEATKLYERFHIYDIYYLPIFSPTPGLFAVASCRKPPETLSGILMKHSALIAELAYATHEFVIGKELYAGYRADEILELVGKKDLTLSEAAEVMGIEVSTANKHVRRLKKKYGVSTISGLVYQGTLEGTITKYSERRRSKAGLQNR